jgi:hypothetical protein
MKPIDPQSLLRPIARQFAGPLGLIRDQIVRATERALQRAFDNDGSLIPIPVRTVAGQRRRNPSRSHD